MLEFDAFGTFWEGRGGGGERKRGGREVRKGQGGEEGADGRPATKWRDRTNE